MNVKGRVLFVLPCTLVPTDGGTKTRVGSLINVLEQHGYEVFIASIDLIHGLPRLMRERHGEKFTFIPFYGHPFALRLLRSAARFVESSQSVGSLMARLRLRIGREMPNRQQLRNFNYFYNPRVHAELRKVVQRINPAHVVFLRHYLYKYAKELGPGVQKIVLTEDRLTERQARFQGGIPSYISITKEQEAEALDSFDLAVSIQEHESAWFRSISRTPVITVGPLLPLPLSMAQRPPGPPNILFIGSAHESNINGIAFFITKVWPLLRKSVPKISMTLGGKICGTIRPPPRVRCIPFVSSLDRFYSDGRVAVSPMFDGTGLKIKSVEALAHGVPVVTTSIAAEGLEAAVNRCIFIGDTPTTFVDQIARLVNEDRAWSEASAAGRSYFNSVTSANTRTWVSIF